MTTQEEARIIDKFGNNYSFWDIPTIWRKRDSLPKPSDPTIPYWENIRTPVQFKEESFNDFSNRMSFIHDPEGLELWNEEN